LTAARRRGVLALVVAAALGAALLVWSPWSGSSEGRDSAGAGGRSREAAGSSSTAGGRGAASTTRPAGIEGGTVRLGLAGGLVVDPSYASSASPSDLMVLDLLYDGLTQMSGPGASAAPAPAVALAWEADAAQRVWRFHLDPAATFASGRPIQAADVVASLEHVIAAGDASPAALRLEGVHGFREYLDGAAPGVAGLRRVDDLTVEISLDSPMAQLPAVLAAPPYGIVDVRGLAQRGPDAPMADQAALDTSGSWQVDAAGSEGLRLRRRAGASGHLDAIELRPYKDVDAAFDAFREGRVDWAPVPSARFGEAVDDYGAGAFAPFQAVLLLGLRADGPVLSKPEVRQAIAAALDRAAIVKAVYPDAAVRLDSIVPRGVGAASDGAISFDPDRARALVRAAFPGGSVPTVDLDYDTSPATEALMALVAKSLDDVGIPTDKHPVGLADYQRLLVRGEQQVFALSWLGGYRSPDAYLDPLLRSSSPDNLVGLRDPGVDAALAAARASADPAVAASRWQEVERSALSSAVLIPIAQLRTEVVVSPGILGLRHEVDGSVDWSAVQLAATR
jgi:ABC-type transport system substrate-binding protein